jgi:serine/threonine-protein kinase
MVASLFVVETLTYPDDARDRHRPRVGRRRDVIIDKRARVLGDRYELGPVIGQGGMGRVYRARDRQLDREVAVKVLPYGYEGDPSRRTRFEREARATARVSHPNVVAVYDEGADGDELYFVMECLPGRSLADELSAGPLPADQVRRIALDILTGLAAAHREGVLHRDIKPANVLLTDSGGAKLGDFGIAKTADMTDLTQEGMLIGTAPYLPPERLRGQPATQSGDLYAIGAVLYEALTGRHPFAGDSPVAIAHAMATTDPPPLASVRPDVDDDLAGAVDRALSRDPAMRFESASSMAAAIGAAPTTASETLLMAPAPTQELVPAPISDPERGRDTWAAGRRGAVLLAVAIAALALTFVVLSVLATHRSTPGTATTSTIPPTTTTLVTTTASTLSPPTSAPPPVVTHPPGKDHRGDNGRHKHGG